MFEYESSEFNIMIEHYRPTQKPFQLFIEVNIRGVHLKNQQIYLQQREIEKNDSFANMYWLCHSQSDCSIWVLHWSAHIPMFHQLSLGKYPAFVDVFLFFYSVFRMVVHVLVYRFWSGEFFFSVLGLPFFCCILFPCETIPLWNWINGRILKPCLSLSEWH